MHHLLYSYYGLKRLDLPPLISTNIDTGIDNVGTGTGTYVGTDKYWYKSYSLLSGLVEDGASVSQRIPLELGLEQLGHVSFDKGCYLGQELIARTHFKETNASLHYTTLPTSLNTLPH
jgi:folate-binding protein YgfZ